MDVSRPLRVCYLVNQYPKISHAFIRREILAVEACGVQVDRISIRPCSDGLVDPDDVAELKRTRVILDEGVFRLAAALALVAFKWPGLLGRALLLAVRLGRRSDRGVWRHLAYLAEACVLWRWLAGMAVDHVHAHFGTNSAAVAMLCRELGGPPYSFSVHGPEEFERAPRLGLEEKIARAAFVRAVSAYGRTQLLPRCDPAAVSKIIVVHCGVDALFLDTPPTPVPLQPRLVCVARLSPEKGQLLLLEALSPLVTEGLPCNLTLVGDGPLRAEIETRIARLGLQQHVTLLGWAGNQEVRQQMLAARALVVSSRAEGLPSVLMEAMVLGRPVISTDVGGIAELVQAGVNGWLIPAGSVEALASALRQVVQAPVATLERLGRAGAETVRQEFNSALQAQKMVALFQNCAAPPPQASGGRVDELSGAMR